MKSLSRPRIAIVARRAEHTSVTRFAGLVTAERLAQAVWDAGGEPLSIIPIRGSDWSERLHGIDGVVMPGGGDLNPILYGQQSTSDEIYGVDDLQDEVDLSLIRFACASGIPLLAICRGVQAVNVALGGTLRQDMGDAHHRHHEERITVTAFAEELGLATPTLLTSCYHHQDIDQVATGLEVIARSSTGVIEAVRIPSSGWAFGVQWHPEDNYDTESGQAAIFSMLVTQARN